MSSRRPQGHVQHGAILGDVDLLAAEHGVDAAAQVALVGESAEQRDRLVGDAVLRVVEDRCRPPRPSAARRASGSSGEQLAQVHARAACCVHASRSFSPRRPLGRVTPFHGWSWLCGVRARIGDDLLSLGDDGVEVRRVLEALGVDLVDVLRARRPGGEPAARGDDLQPADRRVVAGRRGQLRQDRLAGQARRLDRVGRQLQQAAFCSGVAGASMRV